MPPSPGDWPEMAWWRDHPSRGGDAFRPEIPVWAFDRDAPDGTDVAAQPRRESWQRPVAPWEPYVRVAVGEPEPRVLWAPRWYPILGLFTADAAKPVARALAGLTVGERGAVADTLWAVGPAAAADVLAGMGVVHPGLSEAWRASVWRHYWVHRAHHRGHRALRPGPVAQ